jgi:hypothetical protein
MNFESHVQTLPTYLLKAELLFKKGTSEIDLVDGRAIIEIATPVYITTEIDMAANQHQKSIALIGCQSRP